ncbi:cell wall / vacuolar inhibitor of fructosidase 1-like [Spinacia oleracea]|uniref:Cell wall / vacuolar inhibitor of fructosidase 1-like n=1 Tax=Spinacia oleracea TaxID=3562 RepID=A0ABM3RGS3_SPIOL|nr:cell wall / vacuolar inhibitor of fructosidase 1-like [Spinacia oleracea]
MERSSQALVFLSFVSQLIILVHAQNTTLITQICNQTPNNNLCVSTLNSDPNTLNANDTRDLAIIMVIHTNDMATKTQNHIVGLLRNRAIEGTMRQLLGKCYRMYFMITKDRLIETVNSLSAKNYALARDMMKDVQTSIDNCEGSFNEIVKSPISADNKAASDLSLVAYAIVSYISNHNVT